MRQGAIQAFKDILYPPRCVICHQRILRPCAQDSLCADCIGKIRPNAAPFCTKGGSPRAHFYFDRAWAGYAYEGTIKEMLHHFKYNHKIKLGKALAKLMIDFVREYSLPVGSCDYVIPIPLSPARLREREFNQARLLADGLADSLKLKLLDDCLIRIRNTKSQAELDVISRWKNIQGAFKLKTPDLIKGRAILLIDDVLTTGATASEAAKTLKSAGAGSVFALTLAN